MLPGIAIALGGSVPVVGIARVVFDFGVLIAYAGDQGLFFGVRPSLGLVLALRAGG